jgi:hypothetical protein
MRNLWRSVLAVGAVTLMVVSGCTETTEPFGPIGPEFEVAGTSAGGEICWYVGSAPPDDNRHVVSTVAGFDSDRFGEALPTNFFPAGARLVTHSVTLYDQDYHDTLRVGNGYMVSAVERDGRHNYKLYHQVVLQPYVGDRRNYNPPELCDAAKKVHVCTQYDNDKTSATYGDCLTSVERDACVGSFRGLSSETCRQGSCTTRGGLSFVADSWGGFINDLSGNLNNSNGVLESGDDPLVFSRPHGRLCAQYGDAPALLEASFEYSCGNTDTCQFTDTSTGEPATWSWAFGNGSASVDQHPQHTYTAAGNYTVVLTVANDAGSESAATKTVSCTSHQRFGLRCK